MKRRKRRLKRFLAVLAVLFLLLLFKRMFNGTFVYFTTGFDKNTILEVDDQQAYSYEALMLYADIRSQYTDLFGESIWNRDIYGKSFDDYAKEQVRTRLIRVAFMNRLAQERGVVLDRDEKNNVTKAAKEYWEGLSEEGAAKLGVSLADIERMFEKFAIAGRLYSDMTGNLVPEISTDQARVIKIQYVAADSADTIQKAMEQLESGENFANVARSVNGDSGYEYELRRGEMAAEFEDAAFNLASGETSGIVQANNNYYIIKCISDNDVSKTETNRDAMLQKLKLQGFNQIFEPYEASVYVHFNEELWGSLRWDVFGGEVSFEDIFNKYFR